VWPNRWQALSATLAARTRHRPLADYLYRAPLLVR
jgi:hypothetical protein